MVWNYNRELEDAKSNIIELIESNKYINKKYYEIEKNIVSIRKETKKKRIISIGVVIWLIVSMYMSISEDIGRIKNKIIREHGYGMIIENDKYRT